MSRECVVSVDIHSFLFLLFLRLLLPVKVAIMKVTRAASSSE